MIRILIPLLLAMLFHTEVRGHLDSVKVHLPFYGNTNDWSGWNNNGVRYGGNYGPDRNGAPNQAYYFNGLSDYMSFPTKNILNPTYAYSFWFKASALPDSTGAALLEIGDLSCSQKVYIYRSLGEMYLGVKADSDTSSAVLTQKIELNLDEWNHVTVMKNPDSLVLYYNIYDMVWKPAKNTPCYGSNPQARMAVSLDSSGFFHGAIDEIRIFSEDIEPSLMFAIYIGEKLSEEEFSGRLPLKIYPNPVSEMLTVEVDFYLQKLQVLNPGGKILITQTGTTVDVSFLPQGIYFLRLFRNSAVITRKFMIKRP